MLAVRRVPAIGPRVCLRSRGMRPATYSGGRLKPEGAPSGWLSRMARPGDLGSTSPGADGLWLRYVLLEILRYAVIFRVYTPFFYRIVRRPPPGPEIAGRGTP
ncbi:hypothetical protein GCM10029976_097660 [Kribbella albertanoniae]